MIDSKIFFGTNYSDPNSFGKFSIDDFNEELAIAISVGGKPDCHYHRDLNEDSIAYFAETSERLYMIVLTDAFYGARAGEVMVNAINENSERVFRELKADFKENKLKKLMEEIIYPKSLQIKDENKGKPYQERTKTQFSLIVSSTKEILWANFGDTRIYSNWKNEYGGYEVAPIVYHRSLGYKKQNLLSFKKTLKIGKIEWIKSRNNQNPPAIIVCSDGFAESTNPESSPKTVMNWSGKFYKAKEACENMMQKAFENEACDNLSCGILTNKMK